VLAVPPPPLQDESSPALRPGYFLDIDVSIKRIKICGICMKKIYVT
jgi:hypothetical protein